MFFCEWQGANRKTLPDLVFVPNFDPDVFNFCGVNLSPKDFNNKAPGRAAHPGFGGGLSRNAEGVRQTMLWCAARPQAVLLNSFTVAGKRKKLEEDTIPVRLTRVVAR